MARDFLSYTITMIGGDYRQLLLYKKFLKMGFSVSGIALPSNTDEGELHTESLDSSANLLPSDIWITGIPFTKDNTHIYTENKNYLITIDYFFQHLTTSS